MGSEKIIKRLRDVGLVISVAINLFLFKTIIDTIKDIKEINEIKQIIKQDTIKDIEQNIKELLREAKSLAFKDAKTERIVSSLNNGIVKIEKFERDIPEPEKSKIKKLARGVVKYYDLNYKGAIEDIQDVPTTDNDLRIEKFYFLSAAYIGNNNLNEGRRMLGEFKTLVRDDPTLEAKALTLEGNLFSKTDIPEAINCYKKALEKDRGSFHACFNLACLYSRSSNYETSISYLCEFSKMGKFNVLDEIERDADNDFLNLKKHLGPDWKNLLSSRLKKCSNSGGA